MGRILFRNASRRSAWLKTLGMYAEGTALYLFWMLAGMMSPPRASASGYALLRRLGPKTHKHHKVIRNLERAFPDLDPEQRETLAQAIWGNFGALMAEYPHLHTLTRSDRPPYIDVVMDADSRTIFNTRQPAIYVTAHLGNWELVGTIIARQGIPLSVIYGPQRNPVLERMIVNRRNDLGIQLIDKHNGIRHLVREIRAGRSVGLLPDQRVDTGESIPFFGSHAPTTTSPATLALRLGCPLIPVQIERVGHARFRAVFHPPLVNGARDARQPDAVQLTTELNRLFEDWIRHQPDQWICMKRRWRIDTRRPRMEQDSPCA